jgi:hypothetical protein
MPGRIRLDLEVVGGVDVFRRLQHLRIEGHDTFVRGMVIVEGEPPVGVQLAPNLQGSKTPIRLVTCGFARSGRRSDRRESPSLKPSENPAASRVG